MAAPKLSGPFFDPKHEPAIRATLRAVVAEVGADTKAVVKLKAPVSKGPRDGKPAGTLRDSIRTRVSANKKRITLTVFSTQDAINPKGFPYGRAQNAKGPKKGFVDDTLADMVEPMLNALVKAAGEFVQSLNAGTMPPTP